MLLFVLFLTVLTAGSWLLCGLLLDTEGRAALPLQYVGPSLWWVLLLQSTYSGHAGSSSCSPWAQQLLPPGSGARLYRCGTQAELLCSTWGCPDKGLNPCLLPWETDSLPSDRFFTTESQGKPSLHLFYWWQFWWHIFPNL